MSTAPSPAPAPGAAVSLPGVAYIDGGYCPISEARISVLDWGFLRSDATYDVVHVWRGRFFVLDRHLDRFLRSLERLRLTLPVSREELAEILMECVRRSGLRDAYVEMICTRGTSPTFSRDPRDAENRLIAFAIPFGWVADAGQRKRGLDLVISDIQRIPAQSVDPTVKNYHWLDFVTAMFDAYDRGGEHVVLTDASGNITEGPGFNVFVVSGGAIATPSSGVLEGVTRGATLELARELGIPAALRPLPAAALRSADEVFITSTAGGVMAVTRIEGAPVGDGRPGPLTRRLTELYWEKHSDPAWSTAIDY